AFLLEERREPVGLEPGLDRGERAGWLHQERAAPSERQASRIPLLDEEDLIDITPQCLLREQQRIARDGRHRVVWRSGEGPETHNPRLPQRSARARPSGLQNWRKRWRERRSRPRLRRGRA